MVRFSKFLLGLVFAVSTVSCVARLSFPGEDSPEKNPGKLSLDGLDDVDPASLPDGVSYASRVPRLSYLEYDRSVSALLGVEVKPSLLFPAEQPNLGPFESGAARDVRERLLQELMLSSEMLAEQTVSDSSRYAAIVGCTPSATGCRDEFLNSFVRRAYRRSLEPAELTRFQTLFDSGADLVASGDAFRDGVQLVIEAVLQSSKFLYRPEKGSGKSDGQGPLLSDFELATRLAFLFWGQGPDDALLDAAASGKLSSAEGLAAEVARLSGDARMRERIFDFHDRWFEVDSLTSAQKDSTVYPSFGPELVASMRAETNAFYDQVLLTENGAILDLLQSPYTSLDANLASLYGVTGAFGEAPTPYEFAPEDGRFGLLSRGAFLTGHSSASTRTSPILRGVFVLKRLLCEDIPPPPPGAAMEEPPNAPARPIQTTRDYFECKTSMSSCAGCHSTINPVGFAFEEFDGIGQTRTTENGAPIVTSGELDVADASLAYDGSSEFVKKMAELSRVRSCYSLHWLNYAYGRTETSEDARTLARLTQGMRADDFGVREVLTTLIQGASFNHLPPTKKP